MNAATRVLLATLLAALSACGGKAADPAGTRSPGDAGASSGPASSGDIAAPGIEDDAGAAAPQRLLVPKQWMPADWDRDVYFGARPGNPTDQALVQRQQTAMGVPLMVWALAHRSDLDEAYQPAWGWWTALRSCKSGIALMEDLTGEFGDRSRGQAGLTAARRGLKAYAATQPDAYTLYAPGTLGRWDETSGNFQLLLASGWSVDPMGEQVDGKGFIRGPDLLLSEKGGGLVSAHDGSQYLLEIHAPKGDLACVAPDGRTTYTFSMQSSWYIVFGDRVGVGTDHEYTDRFTPRSRLPDFHMTREQAAALVRRNPDRRIVAAFTFGAEPEPEPSVDGILALHGVLRTVLVTDRTDGSVLASKTY